MAAIAFQELTKVYPNGVKAVEGLNLRVGGGELLVLVGPSGCGKTTILRLIAGLEMPTSGTLRFNGEDVGRLAPARRDVAMVFQRPALYPHLSVRENLAFALRLRQPGLLVRLLRPTAAADAAEINERVAEAARLLGLEAVLDRRPAQLSGGQQQRVALGRALVRRPRVLLLDEPLSNLDTSLRGELRRELHLLHRRFPATMLYVTHDPQEALALGERVAVLKAGRLLQVDRPEALYQRPESTFVAQFVGGPMNFFDGVLVQDASGSAFILADWRLPLPAPPGARWAVANGQAVTLGLRAQDVVVGGEAPPAGTWWTLEMRALLSEWTGPDALVTLESDAGGASCLRMQGCQTCGKECKIRAGDTVTVRARLDRAYLFDRTTGAALGSESLAR
jgi:ABC-type sugar transport system ATPase subunit